MLERYKSRLEKLEKSASSDMRPIVCFVEPDKDGYTATVSLWNYKDSAASRQKAIEFAAATSGEVFDLVDGYLSPFKGNRAIPLFHGEKQLEDD